MHDFTCPDTGKMYYPLIADKAGELKQKKGAELMEIWEDMKKKARAEGRAKGKAEGILENSKEIALRLLRMGTMTIDAVAEICKLSIKQETPSRKLHVSAK